MGNLISLEIYTCLGNSTITVRMKFTNTHPMFVERKWAGLGRLITLSKFPILIMGATLDRSHLGKIEEIRGALCEIGVSSNEAGFIVEKMEKVIKNGLKLDPSLPDVSIGFSRS